MVIDWLIHLHEDFLLHTFSSLIHSGKGRKIISERCMPNFTFIVVLIFNFINVILIDLTFMNTYILK